MMAKSAVLKPAGNNVIDFAAWAEKQAEPERLSRTPALDPLLPCDPAYRATDAAEADEARRKDVCTLISVEEIDLLIRYFLDRDEVRNALIVIVQINTGLRISDTLALTWKDLTQDEFKIKIQKTGKNKAVYLNQAVHEAAELYRLVSGRPCHPNDYVFVSESGRSGHVPLLDRRRRVMEKQHTTEIQPLRAEYVARMITKAGKETGLATKYRRISSHTGRKTHANALLGVVSGWELGADLEQYQARVYLAQCALGHAKPSTTAEHYLADTVYRSACQRMNFGLEAIQEYRKERGL